MKADEIGLEFDEIELPTTRATGPTQADEGR
jgi:hypothetical protein